MTSEIITVRMLGGFSIERGGNQINDSSNRMRKVWLLLAYLIFYRNDTITQKHYLSVIQTKDDDTTDPAKNTKALFYRARTLLDQIDGAAGHELIIRKDGSYVWNNDIELELDVEEFERLCREGAEAESTDETLCLDSYQQALLLYDGDLLPKLETDPWVTPLSVYYHRLFLEASEKATSILMARQRWSDAEALCRKALKLEAYRESLYQKLMRCMIASGKRAEAMTIYDEMCDRFFSAFGAMPSDETRAIYREACQSLDETSISVDTIRDQLRENGCIKGAMLCDFDFFKTLYQAHARSIARSGDIIHIVLFSVRGQGRKHISRRSMDTAVENMKIQFRNHLRQGDVISQCSVSQLLVMLPQANYENCCMVSERLLRSFFRHHPHAPVSIHYSVLPLEPSTGNTGPDSPAVTKQF